MQHKNDTHRARSHTSQKRQMNMWFIARARPKIYVFFGYLFRLLRVYEVPPFSHAHASYFYIWDSSFKIVEHRLGKEENEKQALSFIGCVESIKNKKTHTHMFVYSR